MYKRITVAVDLAHGELGKGLLARARQLLDEGGVINLIYVLEEVPAYIAAELPQDIGERRRAESLVELKDLAKSLGAGDEVRPEIRTGAASGQILQCAEDNESDLIMIASHRPGLSDYFVGSTASRVIRHAQCSVLVSR
ncbi:universal stress protein [Rhodobacteraceae bacterium WD3A24]|nr:universal stress protein [Rhodobacteraceae bacterium WD3A24]